MLKRLFQVCSVILLWSSGVLWLNLYAQSQSGSREPITIITEEWPPYNYEEEGQIKGISFKIVAALLKELGRDDLIRLYPSARTKKILDTSRRTMMFSMFRTSERESQYKWIGPIGSDAIYFYKRKSNPLRIHSLDDAKAVHLIASRQTGLVYNILIKNGFTNLDSSAYTSKQVYSKLIRGRADLAISDSPHGVSYWLEKMELPQDTLIQTEVKVVESPLYIACSLDFTAAEIKRWQQALDKIKANGIYDAIYQDFD